MPVPHGVPSDCESPVSTHAAVVLAQLRWPRWQGLVGVHAELPSQV